MAGTWLVNDWAMFRRPRLAAPYTVYNIIMRVNNGEFQIKGRRDFVKFVIMPAGDTSDRGAIPPSLAT